MARLAAIALLLTLPVTAYGQDSYRRSAGDGPDVRWSTGDTGDARRAPVTVTPVTETQARAIPEPSTLLLLGLGASVTLRRLHRRGLRWRIAGA